MGHHKVDPKTGKQVGVTGLLVQVRDGKRQIVMPLDVKTADAVVPMPPWNKRRSRTMTAAACRVPPA